MEREGTMELPISLTIRKQSPIMFGIRKGKEKTPMSTSRKGKNSLWPPRNQKWGYIIFRVTRKKGSNRCTYHQYGLLSPLFSCYIPTSQRTAELHQPCTDKSISHIPHLIWCAMSLSSNEPNTPPLHLPSQHTVFMQDDMHSFPPPQKMLLIIGVS